MDVKNLLNASEAAVFLDVHRPRFYEILATSNLEPVMQTGRIKLYDKKHLKRIKKALNA